MFFQKFATVVVGGIACAVALYFDFKTSAGWSKDPGRALFIAIALLVYAHYQWIEFDARERKDHIEGPLWLMAATGPAGFWAWCFYTRGWKGLVNVAVSFPIYAAFGLASYTMYYVTRA